MNQKKNRFSWRNFWLTMANPLTLMLYWCFSFHLYSLCQFGRKSKNLPILAGCILAFLLVFAAAVFRGVKRKPAMSFRWRAVMTVSLVCMAAVTVYYGSLIYRSAQPYNGKLSWFLYERAHKREVALEHDNLYRDGIDGFFSDLDEALHLPEDLYLINSFNLHFLSDGRIQTIDTFVYGTDENGKKISYLISYDRNKSDKAEVYLEELTPGGSVEQDKWFRPMLTILRQVDLETAVSGWGGREYGILYYGLRQWGNDPTGIVYINEEGETAAASYGQTGINGYTVSLFIPGKEKEVTPIRFLLTDDLNSPGMESNHMESNRMESGETEVGKQQEDFTAKNTDEEYYLNEKEGFRLNVIDAAAGSRYYTLEKSADGGKNWEVVNRDPFHGGGGGAAGIAFLNRDLGFMALSHNGGEEAELFRTADGGKTTERVDLPYSVMEEIPNPDEPFDFPDMPYEEDGMLKMKIGQGAGGDYHGGSKALYRSEDQGVTWIYVGEVEK